MVVVLVVFLDISVCLLFRETGVVEGWKEEWGGEGGKRGDGRGAKCVSLTSLIENGTEVSRQPFTFVLPVGSRTV